jgi:DNA-binding GntR family transcriptional regulator
MKTNDIVNQLTKSFSILPATLCAATIAYTFGCTKPTATKALDMMAAAGLLKKNGLLYEK